MLNIAYYSTLASFLEHPPAFIKWGVWAQNICLRFAPSVPDIYFPHPLVTSFDNCLKNPLIHRETNTKVYLYGSSHCNMYSWSEIGQLMEHIDMPLACVELPIDFYEKYKTRVQKFGVDPTYIKKNATVDELLKLEMVSSRLPKNGLEFMMDHGCYYGNDMASVFYHSSHEPISLDIPRRTHAFLLQDVKNARKKSSISLTLAQSEKFLHKFYNYEKTRQVNIQVLKEYADWLHPPTITQNMLIEEFCTEESRSEFLLHTPRDLVMVRRLHDLCCLHPGRNIFAVVGQRHIPGMLKFWNKHIPIDFFKKVERWEVDWKDVDIDTVCDENDPKNLEEKRRMIEKPEMYCQDNLV